MKRHCSATVVGADGPEGCVFHPKPRFLSNPNASLPPPESDFSQREERLKAQHRKWKIRFRLRNEVGGQGDAKDVPRQEEIDASHHVAPH